MGISNFGISNLGTSKAVFGEAMFFGAFIFVVASILTAVSLIDVILLSRPNVGNFLRPVLARSTGNVAVVLVSFSAIVVFLLHTWSDHKTPRRLRYTSRAEAAKNRHNADHPSPSLTVQKIPDKIFKRPRIQIDCIWSSAISNSPRIRHGRFSRPQITRQHSCM
jgi:hypothetical protein